MREASWYRFDCDSNPDSKIHLETPLKIQVEILTRQIVIV